MEITQTEIWKPVKGFDHYEVSDKGNVRSLDRTVVYKDGRKYRYKGVVLKQGVDPKGYPQVSLKVDAVPHTLRVHRLVANAFVDKQKTNERLEVNHIDGDKSNNLAENLEWVTSSENTRKGYELGLFDKARKITSERIKHDPAFDNSVPVKVTNLDTREILYFDSASLASQHFGYAKNTFTESLRVRNGYVGNRKSLRVERIEGVDVKRFKGYVREEDINKENNRNTIKVFDKEFNISKEFKTAVEASLYFGYGPTYFSEVIRRKNGENQRFKAKYLR